MKGISLAIETIIFIILAVTVLTVLLAFFTKTGGTAQSQIELQQKQVQYCGVYARANPVCSYPSKMTPGDERVLSDTCKSLKISDCTGTGIDMAKCLKQCCDVYCP